MSIFLLLFSRSLIHFHTLYLSLPPASMHSLKLCLIASRHSQQHSALSACLPHTCTCMHAHRHKEAYQPTAMLDIIWSNLWSLHFSSQIPHKIHVSKIDSLCLLSSFKSLFLELLTAQDDLFDLRTGSSIYLSLLGLSAFSCHIFVYGKERHQNRTSKPQWYFKGRSFLFSLFAQGLHFRRMVYCRGPFIMYRAALY